MGLKMDELIAELELLATDCKLEIAKGTLISLIDSNYENSTADFKSAVECEQTSDLFTPEKCRRHVDLCKEIYFLGKGRKYQKISLRSILHKGYIAANFGILMVWKGPKVPFIYYVSTWIKVALSQKMLENFYISNINIPNHYPE